MSVSSLLSMYMQESVTSMTALTVAAKPPAAGAAADPFHEFVEPRAFTATALSSVVSETSEVNSSLFAVGFSGARGTGTNGRLAA